MPRLRIDNLGDQGLNSDIHPTMLPPNAINRCENVLCEDGALTSIGGELKLCDLQVKPLYHFIYTPLLETDALYIVSDGYQLHAYRNDGSYIDLLAGFIGQGHGGRVTFTVLNGILIINSETDGPWYWDLTVQGGQQQIKPLPGWQPTWRARTLVAYKYYLIALGGMDGSIDLPYFVKWSVSADPGSVPQSWQPLVSNDAGFTNIADTPGRIITAIPINNALWVCKEDSIYAMTWVGGQYIFQVTKLTGNIGTKTQLGACEFLNGLAIIGDSDVYYFDGNNITSLVDQKIRKALFARMGSDKWKFAQLFASQKKSKLLLATPISGSDGRLFDIFIYDAKYKSWSYKYLYYGHGFDESFVSIAEPTGIRWDTFTGPTTTFDLPAGMTDPRWLGNKSWDDQDGTWNKGLYDPFEKQVLFYKSDPTNTAWWIEVWHENFFTDSAGNIINAIAGRFGIPIVGADQVAMIRDVWVELTGSIEYAKLYVGIQKSMSSNLILDGPYIIKPNETIKFSPRITGRFLSWGLKIEQKGLWRLGALTIDYQLAGER